MSSGPLVQTDSAHARTDGGPVLEIHDLTKRYPGGVDALRGVDMVVEEGELLCVVGPSGSGKSTLLHIMGTLERPSEGAVRVAGHDVAALPDRQLAALRARHVGFVFQQFFLLEGATSVENVAQGLLYLGVPAAHRRARAEEQLRRVGLGHRLGHRPTQLSGGERQRVAIGRALVGRPSIIFADEPTGNLDSRSGAQIVGLLHELNADGTTIVVISHDLELAAALPRRVHIRDGEIEVDERP
jgi:putative ABC transport system ATP-binding protein